MHRHPSRICVAFVKTRKKEKKQTFVYFHFKMLTEKVINIGNIDYNVCELRLVGMSIQSTVQGLRSQSSCFYFDFMDRPNVFNGSCHFLLLFKCKTVVPIVRPHRLGNFWISVSCVQLLNWL